MNICIGIISYMPDDLKEREIRFSRLKTLLSRCDNIFKKDIIIISQNWGNNLILDRPKNSKIILNMYKNKLGITGARRKLRESFLNSEYDYLIMLDDDSELMGTEEDAKKYLSQIESNPGKFGVFKEALLKLFAISKEMYSLVDFPDLEAERGEIFVFIWLIMYLNKKYPSKKFVFKRYGLDDTSNSGNDSHSTWYRRQWNKRSIGDNTRRLIRDA